MPWTFFVMKVSMSAICLSDDSCASSAVTFQPRTFATFCWPSSSACWSGWPARIGWAEPITMVAFFAASGALANVRRLCGYTNEQRGRRAESLRAFLSERGFELICVSDLDERMLWTDEGTAFVGLVNPPFVCSCRAIAASRLATASRAVSSSARRRAASHAVSACAGLQRRQRVSSPPSAAICAIGAPCAAAATSRARAGLRCRRRRSKSSR